MIEMVHRRFSDTDEPAAGKGKGLILDNSVWEHQTDMGGIICLKDSCLHECRDDVWRIITSTQWSIGLRVRDDQSALLLDMINLCLQSRCFVLKDVLDMTRF